MKTLETPRLYLRPLRAEDAQAMFETWCSDPEASKYLPWEPHKSVEETKKVLEKWIGQMERGERFHWGMELKSDGTLIGEIGVVGYHRGNPVLGSCSGRAYWGNGYMTEALKTVAAYLFEEGCDTIVIEALQDNRASNRVIEKAGATYVGSYIVPQSDVKPQLVVQNSYRIYKNRESCYADVNSETIDRWVDEGWEWGKPISHEEFIAAKAGKWDLLLTPTKPVPHGWLGDLKGKKVLGLASGGGQQMPILTALGAECIVFDYSRRQLESEMRVAMREGYTITAMRGDMTKPLPFADGTFDLIFHPVSNCYVKEVKPIFKECFRVLKKGGVLLAGFDGEINYIVDDDEKTIVNKMPFDPLVNPEQMAQLQRDDSGVQFSHTMEEQIGGQLEAGFILTDIFGDTNGEGYLHDLNIQTFHVTRAVKPE